MAHKLENYLRTYRKRCGLTQDEVAFLLGCENGTKVSRYERFARKPSIETIFGYEVIFDAPPHDLLAGIFQKVEKVTLRRAQLLAQKLSAAKPAHTNTRKLDLLRHISSGSETKPVTHP